MHMCVQSRFRLFYLITFIKTQSAGLCGVKTWINLVESGAIRVEMVLKKISLEREAEMDVMSIYPELKPVNE